MIFHFSADFDIGDIITTEEGELVLLSKEELMNESLFPSVKYVIADILDETKGTVFTTVSYDHSHDKADKLEKKNFTHI